MRLSCRALPRRPMKPVIQQKMPNVASWSLPDAPDRDLHEPRDRRCRWGLKPSTRSGPEKRKERTEIRIAIAIVAFGVGRNHHAQGLRCHSREPAEKRKVSPAVGASFLSRAVPGFCKKSVLFFLFFKKKCFLLAVLFFVFVFLFVFCLCLCLCLFFCFFVFLFFLFFLGVQPARLKGPIQRPEKARRMGGGHERP